MRKLKFFPFPYFIFVYLVISFIHPLFADESITITTYYPSPYGVYKELTTTSNAYLATTGGYVGIGTTVPTVQLERACPAGFTNIKAGNNQLGCMETAEHGSATWYVAVNTCFTTYGGRLPIYSEWYVAMNNYVLTDETDDFEWLGNSDHFGSGLGCGEAGQGGLTLATSEVPDATRAYRCWIPR